jgi:GAF domain-containing protein
LLIVSTTPRPTTISDDLHTEVLTRILGVLGDETDAIALQATVACELIQQFPHFHWVGFYRVIAPGLLKIGPYQGSHGCLTIPFEAGVCGKCAREGRTQRVDDVHAIPHHIACSSSTRSELVVPVKDPHGTVRAVLDIDSNLPAAFTDQDVQLAERLCGLLGARYPIHLPCPTK